MLGVDGYNPSIIQYDVPDASLPAAADEGAEKIDSSVPAKRPSPSSSSPTPPSAPAAKTAPVSSAPKKVTAASAAAEAADPTQKIDSAIQTIARYRTGGDGGQALKLLLTFVKNIAENPDEPK